MLYGIYWWSIIFHCDVASLWLLRRNNYSGGPMHFREKFVRNMLCCSIITNIVRVLSLRRRLNINLHIKFTTLQTFIRWLLITSYHSFDNCINFYHWGDSAATLITPFIMMTIAISQGHFFILTLVLDLLSWIDWLNQILVVFTPSNKLFADTLYSFPVTLSSLPSMVVD